MTSTSVDEASCVAADSGEYVSALPQCTCYSLTYSTGSPAKEQCFLREHFEEGSFQRALAKKYGEGLIFTPVSNHQTRFKNLELLGRVIVKFPTKASFLNAWCSTKGVYKTRNVWGVIIAMVTALYHDPGCLDVRTQPKKLKEEKRIKPVAPVRMKQNKREKKKEAKKNRCYTD